jgi:hypothetical protein
MASKSLRYHYRCQFNHESEGISIPYVNLSYFLGNIFAELPECIAVSKLPERDWTRFPDPLWRPPRYGPNSIQCQFVPPGGYWSDQEAEVVPLRSNPELWRKLPNASGDSRRTTELGRVECPLAMSGRFNKSLAWFRWPPSYGAFAKAWPWPPQKKIK